MKLDVTYPPKNIKFTSNISKGGKLKNDENIIMTCNVQANPRPTYTFKRFRKILYTGYDNSLIYYITGVHEARFISFTCSASNRLGKISKDLIAPLHLTDNQLARYTQPANVDSKWWVYYIVGATILLLMFVMFSVVCIVMRRRMRTVTFVHDSQIEEPRRGSGKINYGISEE